MPTENGTTATPHEHSSGNLYVREDGHRTIKLNTPDPGVSASGFAPATFWDASADGERAFFATTQALTEHASNDGARKLYMWSVAPNPSGGHVTLLAPDSDVYLGVPGTAGAVAVVGASADGSYVYFLAQGQLVAGPSPCDECIFVWHDGTISYIAPIAEGSEAALFSQGIAPVLVRRVARVSPDGTRLLFPSLDACQTHEGGTVPCQELYLYNAVGSSPAEPDVRCVSCRPDLAPATVGASDVVRAFQGDSMVDLHQNAALSADGRFVFFSTAEPLVPEDMNSVEDAYEYDTLTEEVHLLSSGRSPEPSWFLDASGDGHDVFVVTAQSLVGWDRDGAFDLYDVRVGGGLPEPVPGGVPCGEQTCPGAPAGGPAPHGLASGLAAPGNPPLPPVPPPPTGPAKPKPKRHCPKGEHPRKVHHKTVCIKTRKRGHRASRSSKSNSRSRHVCAALLAAVVPFLVVVSGASAAVPVWRVEPFSDSTMPSPDARFEYLADVANVGSAASDGEPVEVTVSLPPGITVSSARIGEKTCSGVGSGVVDCVVTGVIPPPPETNKLKLRMVATVGAGLSGTLDTVFKVAGGGGAVVEAVDPVRVVASPFFGLAGFDTATTLASGTVATVAGSHPFADVTDFALDTVDEEGGVLRGLGWSVEPLRDAGSDLPPGLVGDPSVMSRCTSAELGNGVGATGGAPLCPSASQVGTVAVARKGANFGLASTDATRIPVFELVPPPGVPASFGFNYQGSSVELDAHLRTGGTGYFLSVEGQGIPEGLAIASNRIVFWGDPASEAHDAERACPGLAPPTEEEGVIITAPADCPQDYTRPAHQAFLREPTGCVPASAGLTTGFHADSWAHPGAKTSSGAPDLSDPAWKTATSVSHEAPGFPLPDEPSTFPAGYAGPTGWGPTVGVEGCEAVPFSPSFEAEPTATEADSPSGLHVAIGMPQQGLEEREAVAESDLRKVVLTLPAGVTVNPSAANGQQACSARTGRV